MLVSGWETLGPKHGGIGLDHPGNNQGVLCVCEWCHRLNTQIGLL